MKRSLTTSPVFTLLAESATPIKTQALSTERRRLHSAVWTRLMINIAGWLPVWCCVPMTWLIAGVIHLLAGVQRRAIQHNLAALRPHRGTLGLWWDSYQVFAQFGLTYLDRLWHLHHERPIHWEISGQDIFDKMKQGTHGVLVFTVHSGNYDIGAGLFAERFGRVVHIVRVPEQCADLQELRKEELQREACRSPYLRVHYNDHSNHLGLELCRILQKGEVVAVQGDRVMLAVSPTVATHEGVEFKIPLGPLMLAELTHVPCYPIFLTRRSALHYHVEFGEPFVVAGESLDCAAMAQRWLPVMHDFLNQHWDQWFVFEPLLQRKV